ncbi:hypothetical protein BCV70DRAFT_200782 [Testicularia cyperi]|uniref:Autophagy-related protein 13 n=1 Tax=Testicularia cyperi TaxID=1882483 RepID=A0A317XPS3_9BASI|nr:hypothetical protein BCV70DRAFT_200782 [Testicularia cyperi]
MQSDKISQHRRSSYESHSRAPSDSYASAPGASQSHAHAPQQHRQSIQTHQALGQNAASQLAKLDGVLYHFYTTTANLVLQSRLTRYRDLLLKVCPNPALASSTTAPPPFLPASIKVSKWFGLQIPDRDLFKEELRLWRSISCMLVPDDVTPAGVPDLVIDVILDLSRIPEHHQVLLLAHNVPSAATKHDASSDGLSGPSSTPSRGRVAIDGSEQVDSARESRPRLVVLEQWRLRFDSTGDSDTPIDLPTLYRNSSAHFQSLFSLILGLPCNALCSRLETLHNSAANSAADTSHTKAFPSLSARQDTGSFDQELQIGCRLSMGGGNTDPLASEADEYPVSKALPPELDPTVFCTAPKDSDTGSAEKVVHESRHFAVKEMPPVATPVGNAILSVSFRKLAGYSVEDAASLRGLRDLHVEMDENFFGAAVNPSTVSAMPRQTEETSSAIPATTFPPAAATPATGNAPSSSRESRAQSFRSLITATAHQRIGGITAGRLFGAAGSSAQSAAAPPVSTSMPPPSAVPQPGSDTALSQSPANPSVFSTSAPGRPVAGLASLRRTGSIKSNISGLGSIATPGAASGSTAATGLTTTPSSPALAAALNTEPAFVAPGSMRRASTSERRLRSLSGISAGHPSPPSSPSLGSLDLPLPTGHSAPRSISSAFPAPSSLGRPISSRLTSAGSLGAGSQSRGFNPLSSSPLAQQMSLHGARGASSISASRLSSSPSMRASMAGSGMAVPSLRSVFQGYVLRSPTTAASSFSRTPPTSLTMGPPASQGSYARSSLGASQRSTSSIRRYSQTSDAGSGSAFGTASAAAAAARPQMIKRYSTNFSYRQNRERQSTYGSSLGSEGSGSAGVIPGAEASSYPHTAAAGGSLTSGYGRSWVARMEQRQALGIGVGGGAFARTSSLDDATTGTGTGSSASTRFRASPASGSTPTGILTPSPRSHDDDMDDLMRLLDSKPAFGIGSTGRLGSIRTVERRSASALGSTPEEGQDAAGGTNRPESSIKSTGANEQTKAAAVEPKSSTGATRSSPGGSQTNLGAARVAPGSLSRSGMHAPIRTAAPMSRSQLDDLLNRMAESVGLLAPTEHPGSLRLPSGSGSVRREAVTGQPEGRPEHASGAMSTAGPLESPLPSSAQLGGVRTTRPSVRGAFNLGSTGSSGPGSSTEPSRSTTPNAGIVSGAAGLVSHTAAAERARTIGTGQVRGLRTSSATQTAALGPENASETDAHTYGNDALGLLTAPIAGRTAAPASGPEGAGPSANVDLRPYEPEGDLMFGDVACGYDPEDDLPGQMELTPEDDETVRGTAPGQRRSSLSAGTGSSGRGATLPAGAHRDGGSLQRVRSGPLNEWQRSEQWERQRAIEAERRRADAEMSRNFGQEVGASTRGRGSHSPWRSPSAQPVAVAYSSTAAQTGFAVRSSSSRPLGPGPAAAGYPSSLASAAVGSEGSRRGYGVSAPSTQFHFHPSSATGPYGSSRPSSNSYPVSRDERNAVADGDVEEDEEDDL